MAFLNSLSGMLTNIIICIILVAFVTAGALYYLLKVRKVRSVDRKIDYSTFRREDVMDYVKFEDIVSELGTGYNEEQLQSSGMIAIGKNTFVGGISVIGYEFYDASVEEQQATMAHTMGFVNLIEQPIQIRQTTKVTDLSGQQQRYAEKTREKKQSLYNLQEDYNELYSYAEDHVDDDEELQVTLKKLDELNAAIRGETFLLGVSQGLEGYLDRLSANGSTMERVHQILFTYVFNPEQYNTEMSEADIYLTALRELSIKERSYSQALSNAGCTCNRLTEEELTEAVRNHYQPLTGEETTLRDILGSSFTSLYVTSTSMEDLEKERIGEQQYLQEVEQYRQIMEERLKKEKLQLARTYNNEIDAVRDPQ